MKALNMKQFDEKDEKIVEELISLGINRNVAMALTYLQNVNTATSVDLEKIARLRQPEVSTVMKQLKENDWIIEKEEKKKIGKGRPNKVYSLKIGFNDIIIQLERQQKKALDEIKTNVERLRDLDNINIRLH